MHMTSNCRGFVVQHVVTTSCTTNPQQIEVMESDTIRCLRVFFDSLHFNAGNYQLC